MKQTRPTEDIDIIRSANLNMRDNSVHSIINGAVRLEDVVKENKK